MARSKPIGLGGRWMDELRTGGRFLRGLRPFLKHPLDLAHARRLLDRQLAAKCCAFYRLFPDDDAAACSSNRAWSRASIVSQRRRCHGAVDWTPSASG